MLQDKDIKKIQELKADFTPGRVSAGLHGGQCGQDGQLLSEQPHR